MDALKRHRLFLYGRIAVSVLAFLAFVILGSVAVVTDSLEAKGIPIIVVLAISVLVLPRNTRPGKQEAREAATDEELDHFKRVRRWLTWTRVGYLLVAIGVFVGLPRVI